MTEETEENFERFELVEDIDRRNTLGRIFSGKVDILDDRNDHRSSRFVRARSGSEEKD